MSDLRLIMPNYTKYQKPPTQPLGLYYIKAYLEQNGYSVVVNDTNIEPLRFGNENVVGVYVSTFLFKEAKKIIKHAKEKGKVVVCGGAHVWSDPDSLFKQGADYLVLGDGEYAMLNIMQDIESGKSNNRIYHKPVDNLDLLPFPKHIKYPLVGAVLSTSRGCPYNCSFCSVGHIGRRWRARSPKNVIEEMSMLDGQDISIIDDLFTLDKKRLFEIQELMRKEKLAVSITLGNGTRVDQVDYDRLIALKRMNCMKIAYGIESIHEDVLKACRKYITFDKIQGTINLTRKVGIPQEVFMIIGLPNDTYEKTMLSYKWVRREGLNAYWNIAVPYPNTELFNWVNKYGRWLINPFNYDEYGGHFGKSGKVMFDTPDYPYEQRLKAFMMLSKENRPIWKKVGRFGLQFLRKNKRETLTLIRKSLPYQMRKWVLGIDEIDYLSGKLKLGDES